MTLELAVFWIVAISALTLLGAWYVRTYKKPDALLALYVTLSVAASILASKTISFDFGFTQLFAPGAVLIFSVTFLLTDIVNEKFGRGEVMRMIWLAFGAQIAFVMFSYLVLAAEGAPFFTNQVAFETVLGAVPRLVVAGLIAFLLSEMLDAYLFQWLRSATGGKHLWMRNVFSSLPAMAIDSAVFVTFAFYGIMPILPLIIGLTIVKWLVGILDIPFMYAARAIAR